MFYWKFVSCRLLSTAKVETKYLPEESKLPEWKKARLCSALKNAVLSVETIQEVCGTFWKREFDELINENSMIKFMYIANVFNKSSLPP